MGFVGAYVTFETDTGTNHFMVKTNNAGSALSAITSSSNGGHYFFKKTGNVFGIDSNGTSGNYPGYFVAGLTYNWIAW